jgi:hypothetical protein
MIEVVLRLQAHHERRIAVLFEDDRGDECGLDAHDLARPHDLAERRQRGPHAVMVVSQAMEEVLHLTRGPMGVDDGEFSARERAAWRWPRGGHGHETSQVSAAMPAGTAAIMLY